MKRIDFLEIGNWEVFEDLTADYFREISQLEDNNLTEVNVKPSGQGPDGGRDILLTFRVYDSIVPFERKWVVQCKFYDNLLKSHLDKIYISNLIEEYGAIGYLLVCKNSVHVGVTDAFEKLKSNCKRGYEYEIWNGNHFKHKLYKTEKLHEHYFPEFFVYRKKRESESNIEEILKK
jgi:hypothetical protein